MPNLFLTAHNPMFYLLMLFALPSIAEPVVYNWPASNKSDPRGHYPIALLQLALEKSDSDYLLLPSNRDQVQWRNLRQLEIGQGVDVVWTMTSIEREQKQLPVRIPIDRGLLGWRLLLIRQQDTARFAEINSAESLRKLRAVQGHDWPDLTILQHNQFNVIPSTFYNGMFVMLQLGRVDYFPRALSEVYAELNNHTTEQLAIADSLALYYPAPLYYFVRPDKPALAQAIEQGLQRAIADGSMQQLFMQHFATAISAAKLSNRHIIRLENPLLPEATPLQDSRLWFNPEVGY
ncbi:transporter substrate-binding domain-containing protein [Rheinheimera baltica]|uniref:Transporter substrate-binding domain-containing protein n=1 Tax=Rheinheimera baltica TaxID=67576 RepID=A0ABT9HZE9_9GAMM|nr:transporter substrate-binding domain-containing protein [Rheinheimera baltica]MDP5136510.1 transporter substrate-binding domain-containing protein [Rheinheimera baltica]MDP5144441.1 transporter substrate-binding domain-containing protein [Rheinheimera baltica]MDP5151750.1 transporter substrate-binding domain-containing protein [Rheinheimera baltica]